MDVDDTTSRSDRKYVLEARTNHDRVFYAREAFRGTTLEVERADRFETKEEAEVAASEWAAEGTDWTLGPRKDVQVILVVFEDSKEPAFATGGRSGEVRCMECGATYPEKQAHLINADRMGCVRCR